jgi:hypothetical protein
MPPQMAQSERGACEQIAVLGRTCPGIELNVRPDVDLGCAQKSIV